MPNLSWEDQKARTLFAEVAPFDCATDLCDCVNDRVSHDLHVRNISSALQDAKQRGADAALEGMRKSLVALADALSHGLTHV